MLGQQLALLALEVEQDERLTLGQRLADPQHAALARIYGALRPRAQAQVADTLPRLGATIETLAR